MVNHQRDAMFNYFISGLDQKMQATLAMMYHRSRQIDEANHRREMELMKREIIDYVMSNISATLDVSEIIQEIEELRRAIEALGK